MSLVAITSDLHLHKYKDENNHISFDTIIDVIYQMLESCTEEGVETLIIAGDLFHIRGKINSVVFNRVYDLFKEIVSDYGMSVFLLSGNHDHTFDETGNTSSIYSLQEIQGVSVVDFKRVVVGKCEITFIPYLEPVSRITEEVAKFTRNKKNKKLYKILITHGVVKDSVLPTGKIFEKGIDSSLLDYYDYVVAGHIHHPQKLYGDRVWIPGAPLCHNKKDIRSKGRGFLIFDTENINFIRIPTIHPRFILKRITNKKQLKTVIKKVKERDYLYLIIEEEIEDVENILKKRTGFVECDFVYNKESTEKRLSVSLCDTEEDIVNDYINKYCDTLDVKRLKKISKQLFSEYNLLVENL